MKYTRKTVLVLILLLLSIISFFAYLYLHDITNIKVNEFAKGRFDINNKTITFNLNNLKPDNSYNIALRFYITKEIDISKLIYDRSIYSIKTELLDPDDKVLTGIELNNNKPIPGGYTDDYFAWYIISFNYKKNISKLRLNFISNDRFFDLMKKELVVEKNYDPAALPFLLLIRKALLIVSIISLLLTTLLYGLKMAKG